MHGISLLPVSHVYNMAQHIKVRAHIALQCRPRRRRTARTDATRSRQKALIDSFGSKKRKSQLASKESNRVIVQQHTAAVLDSAHPGEPPHRAPSTRRRRARRPSCARPRWRCCRRSTRRRTEPMRTSTCSSRFIPPPVQQLLQSEVRRYTKIAKDEKVLEQLAAVALAAERRKRNSGTCAG